MRNGGLTDIMIWYEKIRKARSDAVVFISVPIRVAVELA